MASSLLDQFLKGEGTDYVRCVLRKSLDDPELSRKRYEFNRFEVTLDRGIGVVLGEDVLDATDASTLRIPIDDFSAALQAQTK